MRTHLLLRTSCVLMVSLALGAPWAAFASGSAPTLPIPTAASREPASAAVGTPSATPTSAAPTAPMSPPAAAPSAAKPSNTPDSRSPSSASTVVSATEQLDAVLSSLPLLRAQKAAAELQKAIRDAEHSGADPIKPTAPAPETSPLPVATAVSALPPSARRPDAALPDLSFVGAAAFNGQWMATLSDSAGTYDVHQGDTLPSGWRVTRINSQSVELARGRLRHKVGVIAGVTP